MIKAILIVSGRLFTVGEEAVLEIICDGKDGFVVKFIDKSELFVPIHAIVYVVKVN